MEMEELMMLGDADDEEERKEIAELGELDIPSDDGTESDDDIPAPPAPPAPDTIGLDDHLFNLSLHEKPQGCCVLGETVPLGTMRTGAGNYMQARCSRHAKCILWIAVRTLASKLFLFRHRSLGTSLWKTRYAKTRCVATRLATRWQLIVDTRWQKPVVWQPIDIEW